MSPVWVLLLRGVNVGGAGRLAMADLRTVLADLGAARAATYIQSGNAVFTGAFEPEPLARRIEAEIAVRHGFRPVALVFAAADLMAARDGFPFPQAFDDPRTGHVWFLTGPAAPDHEAIAALAAPTERYALERDRFSLHAPDGIGRSRLAQKVETLLGTPATARNLNTVMKICDMTTTMGD